MHVAQPSRNGHRGSLVRAAGGLVWRDTPGGPELALVRSSRRREWSFPKGKLEAGESFAAAALREVAEETGCRARLGAFAGYTLYAVKGRPKLVMFWNMAVERAGSFRPTDEIDALAWLDPAEALARLERPDERRIVLGALAERGARASQ